MGIISNEIWSDLHHDITTDVQGSIKKVINIEAVKTSIHNILNTPRGTRVMLRDFGSNLKSMLFENIDDSMAISIENEIKAAINTWDNRIIVNTVDFKADADNNQVTVVLKFAVRGYDKIFSLSTTV